MIKKCKNLLPKSLDILREQTYCLFLGLLFHQCLQFPSILGTISLKFQTDDNRKILKFLQSSTTLLQTFLIVAHVYKSLFTSKIQRRALPSSLCAKSKKKNAANTIKQDILQKCAISEIPLLHLKIFSSKICNHIKNNIHRKIQNNK